MVIFRYALLQWLFGFRCKCGGPLIGGVCATSAGIIGLTGVLAWFIIRLYVTRH